MAGRDGGIRRRNLLPRKLAGRNFQGKRRKDEEKKKKHEEKETFL